MESYPEVHVSDFVKLMKDYLDRRLDAAQYRKSFFEFSKFRVNVPEGEVDQIIQQAYGDADDYDPVVRLSHTIEEPELRERVLHSLSRLAALGYPAK